MRILLTLAILGLMAVGAQAEPRSAFSRAKTPDARDLARANLKLAWTISLPMLGTRDGIATVQLMPVPDPSRPGAERVILIVQLRSGTLAVYDAETGRKLWSKQPPPAYPVAIFEVAYDPRGALIVVRDMFLYRYDLWRWQSETGNTDETDNRLAVMPTIPSTTPVVVVNDTTRPDEGVIIVCFNGNRLLVYGKAFEDVRVRPDDTVLDWKVKRSEELGRVFKPGDNKFPSLAVARSVFGPDYGLKSDVVRPEPPFPSYAVIHNLSRPNEFSAKIASTPSLTIVDTVTRLSEYSQRDVKGPTIEATTRRGDALEFRIGQKPELILATSFDALGRPTTVLTPKLVLVGTERDIQIDSISEKHGLMPERRLGRGLFRTDIAAPAAFLGNMMYVPTQDGTIYAIDSEYGLVHWTSSLQSVAAHPPAIVDNQVYVTTRVGRLFQLDATTGDYFSDSVASKDGSFNHDQVRQFLAASSRFVYAIDRSDRLVVFDRKRGTRQGLVDVTGFTLTYLNDVTDRVILGSNDGKLICLQDIASSTQHQYRKARPANMQGKKDEPSPSPKPSEDDKSVDNGR